MPDDADIPEEKAPAETLIPVPPAPARELPPAEPEGKAWATGWPEEEAARPVPPPAERRRGRFAGPAPWLPWWRKAVPAAGLALCLWCGWELLGTPWPSWQFPWARQGPVGSVAVIIDPGHGGEDSGAVAQGIVEKDLNLDVGQRVGRALRARGVVVRLTREDDHFVPLEDRVRLANAVPGAVFVSIHFNDASGNGQATGRASGIETYYCEHKLTPAAGWTWTSLLGSAKAGVPDARWAVREGQALADAIQGALIAGTRAENRGIKERSLYVTHRVMGPAVLVEGGFVSHPGEARKLGDPVYRQVLAECIAEGIVRYLHAARPDATLVAAAAAKTGG